MSAMSAGLPKPAHATRRGWNPEWIRESGKHQGCRPEVNQVTWPLSASKDPMVNMDAEMSSATTAPATACSAAAERMRAHRKRRQAGLRCLTIELRETEIDELIRRKLLQADARNDVYAIREALHMHFDRTLGTPT